MIWSGGQTTNSKCLTIKANKIFKMYYHALKLIIRPSLKLQWTIFCVGAATEIYRKCKEKKIVQNKILIQYMDTWFKIRVKVWI